MLSLNLLLQPFQMTCGDPITAAFDIKQFNTISIIMLQNLMRAMQRQQASLHFWLCYSVRCVNYCTELWVGFMKVSPNNLLHFDGLFSEYDNNGWDDYHTYSIKMKLELIGYFSLRIPDTLIQVFSNISPVSLRSFRSLLWVHFVFVLFFLPP